MAKKLTARDVLDLLKKKPVRDAQHFRPVSKIPTLRPGQIVLLERMPTAKAIAPSQPVIPLRLPTARPLPLRVATPIMAGPIGPTARLTPGLRRAIGLEPGNNEPVHVLGKKQTNEVEKALSPEAYRAKYRYARDLTQPTTSEVGKTYGRGFAGEQLGIRGVQPQASGQIEVMLGPAPLNHSGRLRKTGKPCGHWAAFAYLLKIATHLVVGVEFFSGFRCYYPTSSEADYRGIISAGSGSYYVQDYLKGKAYVAF